MTVNILLVVGAERQREGREKKSQGVANQIILIRRVSALVETCVSTLVYPAFLHVPVHVGFLFGHHPRRNKKKYTYVCARKAERYNAKSTSAGFFRRQGIFTLPTPSIHGQKYKKKMTRGKFLVIRNENGNGHEMRTALTVFPLTLILDERSSYGSALRDRAGMFR